MFSSYYNANTSKHGKMTELYLLDILLFVSHISKTSMKIQNYIRKKSQEVCV